MNKRRRNERGQAVIEMLGILPIAILITGAIIQLFLVGYAAVSAESSARLAAREASQGSDYDSASRAAEADVPGIFGASVRVSGYDPSQSGDEPSIESTSGAFDEVGAVSRVKVPFLGFGIDSLDITVTRYAVMPRTDQ